MFKVVRRAMLSLGLALGMAFFGAPAKAVPVGLKLMLLADVSGSVSNSEYQLQKQGYVSAFQDSAVQAAIAAIPGGIVVAYGEWSHYQSIRVYWTHVTDAASANAFAAAMNSMPRVGTGFTAPGDAIRWGRGMIKLADAMGFEGTRKVIDIAGDGQDNVGGSTLAAATEVHSAGITINGLAVLGEPGLQAWYQDNIVTPGGGFLQVANGYNDFGPAIKAKILRELTSVPISVPEPATLALLGVGLIGLGVLRRRRAA